MEAKTKQRMGNYTQIDYLGGSTSGTRVAATETVTKSPLIKGVDRKKPNNFSYKVRLDSYADGIDRFNKSNGSFWYQTSGTLNLSALQLGGEISDTTKSLIKAKALTRLNKAARGDLDLSVSIAEYAQVARMIGGVHKVQTYMKPAIDAYNRVTRKNRMKRLTILDKKRQGIALNIHEQKFLLSAGLEASELTLLAVLKTAGVNWLSWQYGWKPLLNDIWGIADNLLRNEDTALIKLKGSAKEKIGDVEVKWMYGDTAKVPISRFGKYGFKYLVWCKKIRNDNPIGWTSMNPVSIAWELMPYSFVVDWFYNISGHLRNLETAYLNSANFHSGYTTELYAWEGAIKVSDLKLKGIEHVLTAHSHFKVVEFERKVLSSWPFPQAPRFKVDLGSDQLKSAASLLAIQLRIR